MGVVYSVYSKVFQASQSNASNNRTFFMSASVVIQLFRETCVRVIMVIQKRPVLNESITKTQITMKKLMTTALLALAIALTVSCSKDDDATDKLEFVSSNIVPELSIDEGTPLNLIELNGPQDVFTFNSNVPYITGKFDKPYAGYSGSMEGECEVAGTQSITVTRMSNLTNTVDESFVLVENPFTGQWINYCNDGPLQIIVTVRIRVDEGTKYIDMANPLGTAVQRDKKNYDTYVLGTLKAISNVTAGSEKRAGDAQTCWGGYFPELGSDSNAAAEYVTLTITDGENDVDIKVWGQKRENEISKLLEYVQVGDMVEVPAITLSTSKELLKAHVSTVLKIE